MEASPLTRQSQPEVLTPKIHDLYSEIFKNDEEYEKTDGFWKEFFLLRPDRQMLRRTLQRLSPAELLAHEAQSRELFSRSVQTLHDGSESSKLNALDTLTVFLCAILSKRFPHPSSAIISLLAGIDRIDAVFTSFIGTLETVVKSGPSLEMRHKAVEVLLALMAGAYQTTLLTYMIQRDLFPAVMKLIQDSDGPEDGFKPLVLISLLANYNKFEFQNPYQLRLNDFVNESTIRTVVRCVGYTSQTIRNSYIDVQDDMPEGWTFSSTMNMIGLGAIVPGPKVEKKPVYDDETARKMFTKLPDAQAAILLAMYDFAHANKLFCFTMLNTPTQKGIEHPLAGYLSLTSYLLQHAHLSHRATYYAHLNLMVFRLLVEDNTICKRISMDESKMPVRLCRHRAPFLPLVKGERPVICSLLDIMIDGINHNLKRRLDVSLYTLCLGILLRTISFLSRSNTRLVYHWSEFFRSLLSLVRFLTTYTSDLQELQHIDTLVDHVVNLIALSLSAGEAFLPSPTAYDDLFYKVVESGEILSKFKENYNLAKRNSSSIDTLISVSTHYKQLLAETSGSASKKKASSLTAGQVTEVIKQGYETLSIQAAEGLDSWDRYREADERMLLKRMIRTAVEDVNGLLMQQA